MARSSQTFTLSFGDPLVIKLFVQRDIFLFSCVFCLYLALFFRLLLSGPSFILLHSLFFLDFLTLFSALSPLSFHHSESHKRKVRLKSLSTFQMHLAYPSLPPTLVLSHYPSSELTEIRERKRERVLHILFKMFLIFHFAQ